MKASTFFLISGLVLCSCFSENNRQVKSPLNSSSIESNQPADENLNRPEPSIFDCPAEDIAEYPVSIPIQQPFWDDPNEKWAGGGYTGIIDNGVVV
ncbi:MAG: hypothetical protein FWC23_02825 [Chitinispirillia bacterium]|nr:hypothetical protein [Chitinispirillia bacterium]MCL2268109.1 hypothetical protein [Chitinispirillia bacterium]